MAKVLVTGASGFLGSVVAHQAAAAGHQVVGTWLEHPLELPGVNAWRCDLADPRQVAPLMAGFKPDWVFHLAAQSKPDACALDPQACARANAGSTWTLAAACGERGAWMGLASSDLIWPGKPGKYLEDDPAAPLGKYGRSKAQAEDGLRDLLPGRSLSLRLSLLYGWGRSWGRCFAEDWVARLRAGHRLKAYTDQLRCPIHAVDVAEALMAAAQAGLGGSLNTAGPLACSRHAFALELCAAFKLDPGLIDQGLAAGAVFADPRPLHLDLDTARLAALLGRAPLSPHEGLARMAAEEPPRRPS